MSLTPRIDDLEGAILVKADPNTRSSTVANLLLTSNIPAGTYKITIGAQRFTRAGASTGSRVDFKVDGTNLFQNQVVGGGVAGFVISGIQSDGSNNPLDYGTSSFILTKNSTWSAAIDVTIISSGSVDGAYYIIERISESTDIITTEWD